MVIVVGFNWVDDVFINQFVLFVGVVFLGFFVMDMG